MVLRVQVSALAVLSLLFWCGCSSSAKYPETVPVSGKVTLGGKPLAGATVAFHPVTGEGSRMGSGTTDSSGRYSLTTFKKNDGVPPGKYQVTINKAVAGAVETSPLDAKSALSGGGDMMKMMKQAAGGRKKAAGEESEVPAKFANAKTSGMEREASKAGPNTFDFDL